MWRRIIIQLMCIIEEGARIWLVRLSSHLVVSSDLNSDDDSMYIAVLITDQEYPVRPAFSLLSKILEEFATAVPESSYTPTPPTSANSLPFPAINTYLVKYQDPKQADAIMRVQNELDETKIILVSFFV